MAESVLAFTEPLDMTGRYDEDRIALELALAESLRDSPPPEPELQELRVTVVLMSGKQIHFNLEMPATVKDLHTHIVHSHPLAPGYVYRFMSGVTILPAQHALSSSSGILTAVVHSLLEEIYEVREKGCFCRLCWKYAERPHISSRKHLERCRAYYEMDEAEALRQWQMFKTNRLAGH